MASSISPVEKRFLALATELAESLSLSGTLAQIYALLYIKPAPLSLDDIAGSLGMSKGNASVNLRILDSWGAVRKTFELGSRRDHYEAVRDLGAIAVRRIQEGFSRRLGLAQERIGALMAQFDAGDAGRDAAQARFFRERVEGIQKEMAAAQRLLERLQDLYKLRKILR